MPRKSYKPEEIVAKLRQVDVLTSQGQNVADAIRAIGVSEVTYYRWRQEFGGLKNDQVKRLKELEAENTRLRRAISDLTALSRKRGFEREAWSGRLATWPISRIADIGFRLRSSSTRSGCICVSP